MLQRDGYNETGCMNTECSGFIRADGAVIAPGDVIKLVPGVPNKSVQKITIRVLKVIFSLFFLFLSPSCYFHEKKKTINSDQG
jgi:hypothetical protein